MFRSRPASQTASQTASHRARETWGCAGSASENLYCHPAEPAAVLATAMDTAMDTATDTAATVAKATASAAHIHTYTQKVNISTCLRPSRHRAQFSPAGGPFW